MTKQDLINGTIAVFANGENFISGTDFSQTTGNVPFAGYPTINPIASNHPFIHYTGGFEERDLANFNIGNMPIDAPIFFYNQQMSVVLNVQHDKTIDTQLHTKIDVRMQENPANPYNEVELVTEKPDLFDLSDFYYPNRLALPFYGNKRVLSAANAGHNYVCQETNGLLNKMCHELWRLKESGISKCFFIALYTHKKNVQDNEAMPDNYKRIHRKADKNFAIEIQTYRKHCAQIDSDFSHLIFKGIRPLSTAKLPLETFFNVFIVELLDNLKFKKINQGKAPRVRPENFVQ